jgi:hypothetical protein
MRRRGRVRGCLALGHAAVPLETEALPWPAPTFILRVVLEVSLASAKQGYSRHRKSSAKRRRVGKSVYRNDRPQRVCQASSSMVALLAVSHWRWFSLVAEVTR